MRHQEPAAKEENRYQAYLLRLWRETSGGSWRLTLEDPHSDVRHAFRDIDGLIDFLKALTQPEIDQDIPDRNKRGGKKDE